MSVLGIDQITYSTDDLPTSRRFFQDWGLTLASESADELAFVSGYLAKALAALGKDADHTAVMQYAETVKR